MQKVKYSVSLVIFILVFNAAYTQTLVNFHVEESKLINGQVALLHKPVIVGSLKVYCKETGAEITDFRADYLKGILFLEADCHQIRVAYRSFRHDFSSVGSPYRQVPQAQESSDSTGSSGQLYFNPGDYKKNTEDKSSRISMQGSIARGLNVGNNQNAVLNSNLNLQVDGDLGDGLMLKASVSDRNIPVQPDGTTQQLQDFDQVFIEVYNQDFKLTAGDFSILQNRDAYLRYQRKSQGALLETKFNQGDKLLVKSSLGGAVARGKYHRMEIQGEEGNQGPYKLTGANNESWIIVLSGSERIYIDGELLIRGQSADYTIDYNTGELSFTARRLITKDSRIVAEFEYSDRNYNRFMLTTEHEIITDNSRYFVRYFSDSDAKNQPVDQSLDADKRLFLSGIGDDLEMAAYPSFDSLGYESGQIRYRLADTLVNGILYDSVFVYSVNPEEAVYLPGFSLVGENKGNYVKLVNSANGRVYEWVAPENGVPRGNYDPVSLLVTPKKQQMISLGGENQLGSKTRVDYEFALSNHDLNMYSSLDSKDDKGYALSTGLQHNFIQKTDSKLRFRADYGFIQKYFTAIENFRETEFTRNWNINSRLSDVNEHNGSISLSYEAKDHLKTGIKSAFLYRQNLYQGFRQDLDFSLKKNGWDILMKGNLLNTNGVGDDTRFVKHRIRAGKQLNHISFYAEEYQEWNHREISDSLLSESFRFQEMKAWVNQGKRSSSQWKIEYRYRLDELPVNNQLSGASESHDVKAGLQLVSSSKRQVNASLGYRKLDVLNNDLLNRNKSQNSLIAQMLYNETILDGFLQSRMFYESGSGLELKKEFTYIEVPAGQGVYQWSDYNGNGLEELDEFEIAAFPDEARYIRIYIPTSESIRTFNNQVSLSLQIRPEKLAKEGKGNFLKRFNNQLSFNLANKNTATLWYNQYTPLANFSEDSSLVYLNNSFRNTFSFNRFSNVFAVDLIHQRNQSQSLLVNGLDRQGNALTEFRGRLNFTRSISMQFQGGQGNTEYESEYFSSKNYDILWERAELSLNYQPDINKRIRLFGEFTHKENLPDDTFSRLFSPGIEYRNNAILQGMLSIRLNYTLAEYSGKSNSSLEYQMLDALLPGHNYIMSISFQKRLVNGLQLNFNYQGRKSGDEKTVHTGGVQIRAYF